MKYFNKTKTRRRNWTVVIVSVKDRTFEGLKVWCQRHPSTHRFYGEIIWNLNKDSEGRIVSQWAQTKWWFENPEDALVFKLMHD
jgi:hypothetical protein